VKEIHIVLFLHFTLCTLHTINRDYLDMEVLPGPFAGYRNETAAGLVCAY